MTVDQPIFAIAKKKQWSWPEVYGESKYVVMMGEPYIEMVILNVFGHWSDGSGWLSLLTTANVITDGRADALKKGPLKSRSRWTHQVTAAILYCLCDQAYNLYKNEAEGEGKPCILTRRLVYTQKNSTHISATGTKLYILRIVFSNLFNHSVKGTLGYILTH